MEVSAAAFLIDFPEFDRVDRLLIERKLVLAEKFTPESTWGTNWRDGIMLYAAHLIASTPLGQQARLENDDKYETTYLQERRDLERVVAMGLSKVI